MMLDPIEEHDYYYGGAEYGDKPLASNRESKRCLCCGR